MATAAAWRAITVATPCHFWLIVHILQGEGLPPARSRPPIEAACSGLAVFWEKQAGGARRLRATPTARRGGMALPDVGIVMGRVATLSCR